VRTTEQILKDAVAALGLSTTVEVSVLARYVEQRSAYLGEIRGQPGWEEAARAERDSVLLRAGISATVAASAAEQQLYGVVLGILLRGTR
jgi:hypothetical protein